MPNFDPATAAAFDDNWSRSRYREADPVHVRRAFEDMFGLFPFDRLGEAEGFDLGCGTGVRAAAVAPLVGRLHCIDPAPHGIAAARRRLAGCHNVTFHLAGVDAIPLPPGTQDFGYSLGVLHHIPDPEAALRSCVSKLKPGAPFLLYLYYDFENRPLWFRGLWRLSDLARRLIAPLPFPARRAVSDAIALLVYLPLSRSARLLERAGIGVANLPLSYYRRSPVRHLRSHALDRFGTPLEQRFSSSAMKAMMTRSGLERVTFQDKEPYWVAIGYAV